MSGALQKAKFWVGPTAFRPGPMLPMVAAEAVALVIRSGPFASAASQGRVGVLRRAWLTEWFRELEMFPGGSHDDQVDSASGAHAQLAVVRGTTWDDLYPPSSGPPAP